MMRIAWIACLVLIPQADDDAGALIKALQEKTQKAKSLRVAVSFAYSESGPPHPTFSGEIRANGPNQWLLDFSSSRGDGLEERFRAVCDGKNLGTTGFQAEAREAREPERYARQVRDWCATSLIPVFFSFVYKSVNQKNNLPALSGARSLGREKVGAVEARVVEYLVSYPTQTKVQVKAWIDPVGLRPLKRVVGSGMGGGLVETFTSFEIDPETPDAVFAAPETTEADQALARLLKKGLRHLTAFHQALGSYQEHVGRYPTTAQGLDALVQKPEGALHWEGPYLEESVLPKDPWGNAYEYRFPGVKDPSRFELSSPVFENKYKLPLERMKELLAADDREAAVAAALQAIIDAEIAFKSKDPDDKGGAGHWVGDLSGLYRYLFAGKEIRLIPREVAEADVSPLKIKELSKDWPEKPVPYHGYLFSIFSKHLVDGKVQPYHTGSCRNAEQFAVVARPADYPKDGRFTLIVDDNLNILRRDLGGKTIDTCPTGDEPLRWRPPPRD
ncbi:MAG TPA: type II secretion system protein GspG [Planctomycetota bacterium]|nr:type II secretion system protein GspG [Planctomycetota bacterium]